MAVEANGLRNPWIETFLINGGIFELPYVSRIYGYVLFN